MIFLSVPGETDGAAKVGHGLHGGEGVGTTTFPGIRSGKIRDEKILQRSLVLPQDNGKLLLKEGGFLLPAQSPAKFPPCLTSGA